MCADRIPWFRTLILLAGVFLVLPPAGFSQVCTDCHDDVAVAEGSVHEIFGCADCHSDLDAEVFPHPEDRLSGDLICSQCHEAGESVATSVHAELAACTDCHGAPHEILLLDDRRSPVSPLGQTQTCATCHGEELADAYASSVHGVALIRYGLAEVAPTCSSCHGAHDILPASDPESRTSWSGVPDTCGGCHSYLLDTWKETSAHGLAWQDGNHDAPVCITCHTSHEVTRQQTRARRLEVPGQCGDCHGDRFTSYRDNFHGQVTDLGFALAANCADCHTPHRNLAAADPRSSIHPDHLEATCGQCHDEANARFVTFNPHSEPADPEQSRPTVHLTWWFMTSLLIGVFAFFGLHDLLWLQRSLVGWTRGEFSHLHDAEAANGPWVRRFRDLHIGVHITVVVTFLVLAATGLPLKFHTTDWARALMFFPGSVALARFAHRTAAVLTFGYALVHLGFLVRRVLLEGDRGLIWGWRSMVPQLRDVRDLWAHLQWFLYVKPRPRFGRWTYWEKFDYFAVFWGVAIIGLSGLMLWLPGLFTLFLPGWVLNVAHVIHSDEALLATGFIFLFHFFHSHLRPEAFPMDPVIFTGRVPLERFKEERPEEYERLVERGELESYLVEPPTEARMRFARIFGFTALVVGLLLAVGILVGLTVH